jgi:hypothetical protein
MQAGLTVETIEIGADQLAVLHPYAGVVDQVRYTARWADLIVGAVLHARLGLDDLDAILQPLLHHHDAREPRVWRAICHVELHRCCTLCYSEGLLCISHGSLRAAITCASRIPVPQVPAWVRAAPRGA